MARTRQLSFGRAAFRPSTLDGPAGAAATDGRSAAILMSGHTSSSLRSASHATAIDSSHDRSATRKSRFGFPLMGLLAQRNVLSSKAARSSTASRDVARALIIATHRCNRRHFNSRLFDEVMLPQTAPAGWGSSHRRSLTQRRPPRYRRGFPTDGASRAPQSMRRALLATAFHVPRVSRAAESMRGAY